MTTRGEAIRGAADVIADAYVTLYGFDGTTVEDAARAAFTPGGPSVPELEDRIRARRAELTEAGAGGDGES